MKIKCFYRKEAKEVIQEVVRVFVLVLFVVCGFFPFPLSAQYQLQFNHYSLDQGYYDGIVTSIYQDKYRYIWIGTADGLYRFDGYEFKEYRKNTDDPGALRGNVITDITEDQQGHLWVGTEGGGLSLLNRKADSFTHFSHDPGDPNSIASNFISEILEDRKGNLWIGTDDQGLSVLKYDENKNDFYFQNFGPFADNSNTASYGEINDLFEDSRGNLWVGTDGGLVRIQYASLSKLVVSFFNHDPQKERSSLPDNVVFAIEEDPKGGLWIGTRGGLSRWDPVNGTFKNFLHNPADIKSLSNNAVRTLEIEDEERIWVGTQDGLNLFNTNNFTSRRYHHHPGIANSVSEDFIMRLYKDQQGNTWVGTWGGALNRVSPLSRQFTHFPHIPGNDQSLSSPVVRSITEDTKGRLWMATANGLDCFDRDTQQYTHYTFDPDDPSTEAFTGIFSVYGDRSGHIWIGTSKGAFRMDPGTGQIGTFKHSPEDLNTLPRGSVWNIMEDSFGKVWMAIYGGGVACLDPASGQITKYKHDPFDTESLSENRAMIIYEARNKDIWVGTYEGGLTLLKRDEQGSVIDIIRYQHDPADASSISSNVVWSILDTKDGNMWVGTGNGLNRMNLTDATFKSYQESDGLINNFVFGLLSGQEKQLWLSTNRGLALFDPSLEVFQTYDARDGLQQNEFNKGAFWKGKRSGELFFGGVNGMVLIRNEVIEQSSYQPQVSINKMVIYETDNELNQGRVDYGIGFKDEIKLAHFENTLEFEFTALNFINEDKNKYSYRLKGLSNKWVNLGPNHVIRFGGLSPGKYTLEVRAANVNDIGSAKPAELDIIIQAPWWATWPAKVFYALAVVALLFGIYRFILSKKLAERESERLREQDAFKTRLYTEITHEFRTPLTVISGMTDLIKGNNKSKELIKRNTHSLLNLVNQMLELRKLESGGLTINYIQSDIVRFVRYVVEPFYDYAKKKQVQIHLFHSNDEIWMDFDPEIMKRIITNLVSNAIKYNKPDGKLDIQLSSIGSNDQSKLLLIVKDTGIGIADEQKEQIFKRFYQIGSSDNPKVQGTGLGLALVKEYVDALKGLIQLESSLGEGTTFKIELPISRKAEKQDAPFEAKTDKKPLSDTSAASELRDIPQESVNPEQPRILILEDNPDVMYYLKTCLSGLYNVQVEDNGADGVRRAFTEVPDLIISDVMMPEKDGFELVETLKTDIRTSHIPIILLTAKSDTPSKLKGLELGADAYLTKPFNRQELLVRVANMLELRKKLQERYQSEGWRDHASDLQTQKEDEFIQEVQQIIQKNLSDPDFNVIALCKEIGMSRTQLHNKLKAITNRSASIYIRFVRLKEARHLLGETDQTISEIAFQVGFKDPNYFSRTFHQEFGASPSQFRSGIA